MNLGPNTIASTYQYILNQSGNSITLGNGNSVNWAANGIIVSTGTQNISGNKTFKNNLNVDGNCILGGSSSSSNEIGCGAASNLFGVDASSNQFGNAPSQGGDLTNYFGSSAQNIFGQNALNNYFGQYAYNQYGSGLFDGPIRLFLPQFSGSSSQAGQFGELKISGSGLYVCTGSNLWGRFFISSF